MVFRQTSVGGMITGGVLSGTLGPVVMYNEYMDVNKTVNYMGIWD
jgi:hypothetical protein